VGLRRQRGLAGCGERAAFWLIFAILAVSLSFPAIAQESTVTLTHVRTIEIQDVASGIAWSQDGTRLAAIHNYGGTISIWDNFGILLRTVKRDETLGPYSGPIAFLPDSHLLLGPAPTNIPGRQTNTFAIWNVDTGEIERVVSGISLEGDPNANRPTFFVPSCDGSYVAADMKSVISVYSTRDWQLLDQQRITRADLPLDYANDKTPPDMLQIVNSLAWSSQNLLAIGLGKGVAFIAPPSPTSIVGFIPSVDSYNSGRPIGSLAFSPNGDLLALGVFMSIVDGARKRAEESGSETAQQKNDLAYLKIWDVSAKQFIAYDPSVATPRDVEWSSDGRFLLVLTIDGHLRIYTPLERRGTPEADFTLDGRPIMARFSPATGEWAILLDAIGHPPLIETYKIRTR
jgi:WD40 repeat protein